MFPMQEVSRQKQGIRGVSFSHDSRFIACVAEHENYIDVALVETGEKVWSFQNEERDDEEHASLCCMAFHPTQLYLACAYDHKKSHKDGSFVRLFGGSGPYDDKKKDGRDSRGRSRERETKAVKKPLPVKVEKDKDGKERESKIRVEVLVSETYGRTVSGTGRKESGQGSQGCQGCADGASQSGCCGCEITGEFL